jgi:hypothetical protein
MLSIFITLVQFMRIFIASNQQQSAIALISKPAATPVAYGSLMHVLLLLLLLLQLMTDGLLNYY